MRFEYPKLLLLLLIVPALGAFFWWSWREKQRVLDQFVNPRLLPQLMSGISRRLQRLHWYLLLGAAALLVVALARLQWGFDWEEVRQRGLDIVVAIDTSRSMLAEDVQPNRLTRAKLAALDLRKLAKADRMGLVAFAGTAFLQCPLSADDEAFRQSIDELNVNIIPQGGTAVAEAIQTARMAFKDKTDNHKVLVLFTDGEDHDGHAVEAAKEAAKDGMRIFTIGVGTRNGELLRITDARGRSDYIKDPDGNVVKSRLDEGLLTQIAEATGGFYLLLGGARTIEALYETGLAPMPKSEKASRQVKRYHERFQWALFLAIVLLIGEMFVPERKRVARKAFASAPTLSKAAAAVLLCCLLPTGLIAASASKALKEYGSHKFERALHQYQDLLENAPNDARLNFNAGDAAFESGFYDKALKHFNSSLATEDLQLQERSFYNLGNAHYRIGEQEKEPPQKQADWEQAVTSYESALKLNPNDADAKYNLDLVKKKLEELKQQQQQNKDNQNQDKSDDKEKKDQDKQQQQQQNQDQQKQSKSDQKKEDQKQQEQQNQDKQRQEDQKQAQQQKPDQKDQSQQQQAQQKPGNDNKQDEQEADQPGHQLKSIQMTPQQAVRLLESAKQEERTLVFIPPNKTNRNDRLLKDW
ncbi:MAG TPA: VWA domain-containing protein [Verrucomicrobiae bacterium]|nr:VWA domain-containing protein [Verrucomicrobiae bacterium]